MRALYLFAHAEMSVHAGPKRAFTLPDIRTHERGEPARGHPAGFGFQFIPRVGQEVVVTFEGGDPVKPIVLGAVYNGTHPPPFLLPDRQRLEG